MLQQDTQFDNMYIAFTQGRCNHVNLKKLLG